MAIKSFTVDSLKIEPLFSIFVTRQEQRLRGLCVVVRSFQGKNTNEAK